MSKINTGVGLVLAGGGGKGAYQIGVWKALREYGVDKNITAVSGTSVGALNAALFVHGDYQLAEKVWLSISQDKILSLDKDKLIKRLVSLGLTRFFPITSIISFATNASKHGVFTRTGLLEIINNYLDLNLVKNSPIPCYATCFSLKTFKSEYFNLDGTEVDKIMSILLATSAIPFVYDEEEIDNKHYIDGGVRDNLPIQPLYDKGYRHILAIHLSRDSIINKKDFPQANIIEILPQEDQGGLISGTLDFSAESAMLRMQQGYTDGVRVIKAIYESGKLQLDKKAVLEQGSRQEAEYLNKRTFLLKNRQDTKRDLHKMLTDLEE
ncbi:NTE family protein [Desulfitispora alkaliphila]|uniref:patatin-like phospholipase family protein n=1 Tax=Desulfitispora alkaliphila TaxID=622674 RepID=UPI003D1EBA6B